MKKVLCFLLLATILLALSACQQAGISPAATPTAVSPTPTASPRPSVSPSPTPDTRCNFPGRPWNVSAIIWEKGSDDHFWQVSTPEEQGLDPELLNQGLDKLSRSRALYSFLIVRHDCLIVERYFNGRSEGHAYEIASVAKSIMSTLVGIALEEGYLQDIDQKVADLLPQFFNENTAPAKQRISLRHLLTMRAGLFWEPTTPLDQVRQHAGLVQSIINQPLEGSPGSGFLYSTGLAHIMSAILTTVSGMSTCEFAYRYLFDPLDISVEYWGQDGDGYFTGGWYMYLTPRELAKIGLLYLHQGRWQSEQIVPQDWVLRSCSRQVASFPGESSGYGYWWWVSNLDGHEICSARGGGEQRIYIIPDLDMVIVTTSDHAYQGSDQGFDSLTFIWRYVLPAVVD